MIFPLIVAAFGQTVYMLALGAVALFLILLVLVQRGRGGGLAGALGGMGGSSAFGAKAGDVFTKITAYTAIFWIILCIYGSKMTPSEESLLNTKVAGPSTTVEEPSLGAPAEEASEEESPAQEGSSSESESASEAPADTSAPVETSEAE